VKRVVYLLIAVLLLALVSMLTWLTTTEGGLRWAYQQIEPRLPGELAVTKLEGRLIGPITARSIAYQLGGTLIKADQLILEWQPSALLAANVDISRLHIRSLKIVSPEAGKTGQPLTLPEVRLPLRVALKDVVVDGFNLSQNDQSLDLQQIRLKATTVFSQVDIKELSINTDTLSLNIKGELQSTRNYPHELEIQWQAKLPSGAVIEGNGQLAGDTAMTRIKQHLSGPLQLTLDAELNDLLDQLNWQAKVDVTAFDASQLDTDWPAVSGQLELEGKGDLTTATLSGKLDGNHPETGPFDAVFRLHRLGDNSLQVEQLALHSPASETRLQAEGQWRPGANGGDLTLALQWENLRWPLKEGAWLDSASGSGWIEGSLDHYRFGLATDHLWPQVTSSSWNAAGEGDLEGLHVHSLHVAALGGNATASGQLAWSPQLAWKAEISATGIDPGGLWPQWPGRLDATLTSSGRFENGQLSAAADITQLAGTLRDYPVALRSRLDWRNQGLDIALLDFRSGTSRVSAKGRIGETLQLDWTITATDLAELYPRARGQLRARGLLAGTRDVPVIDASFSGTALNLPEYGIGAIEGTVVMDLFRWRHIDIRLAAQALKLKGYTLQTLDIDADTRHLTAKAVADAATALVELKGEASAGGWRGHVQQANIQSPRFGDWQLKAPAALNIGGKTLAADTLCWHNGQEARLCASLQREDQAWQTHLDMSQLPLLLLGPWLHPDLKLEGVADATADLQFHFPDQLLGQVRIELPPGAVGYPLLEGERDRWEYRNAKVAISLKQQGLEASAEIAMTNGDRFQGQLALPGAELLALKSASQPLQANAQLNSHDLGLIEALVPEVQDLQGEVALNLSATGTLARPKLSGHAQLLNGALRIPRLGLNIDELKLNSQSDGFENLNFHLDARSGDGTLAIQGQTVLDRSAGWPTEISVKGDKFEVSRIPEAQVLVSPDLQIKLQKRTIDIKGDIHIPYARLQPKDITMAARVSGDAVIIGDAQPTAEKWSIVTRIRLTLGEQVNFYGFGFEGRFGGSLFLEDEPGKLTRAIGEISIPEGSYRAYGQRLDVERGRLLYAGGSLTNPGLDLRAVRHVSNVTAGIKIRGDLDKPQLELFSVPAMGQTDALSYLLLGHPVDNASGEEGAMMAKAALALGLSGGDNLARTLENRFGLDEMRVESKEGGSQASLVIGRYLSPKLYVSYGVGLIEAVNTLNVRYQISDKWQLKAESGEYQGTDILYTIER